MTASDRLAALVGRAVGTAVTEVATAPLPPAGRRRSERVRFRAEGRVRTLVFDRYPPDDALAVRLLPVLARSTDRVPAVFARGEPHLATASRWLLREDTGGESACDGDPKAIVDAKLAVERGVARDADALRALGVRERTPADVVDDVALVAGGEAVGEARRAATWLRRWPTVLCHGDLRCDAASATDRGVVLTGWERAHLGCGLLDVVRLAADLGERGDAILGVDLPKRYAEAVGVPLSSETLRAAELVDRLARRHLRG